MTEITRNRSSYAPASVGIGIVHIGLGAFHRAHQAAYVERWLNRNDGGDWGICAANIRSNALLVERMTSQNCRYHIAEYADGEHVAVTEINSIRQALFARDDNRELLDHMTAPTTRIVSLTVTEKGYYLSPANGELCLDDPAVVHDRKYSHAPQTAPGLVLEALKRRRSLGIAPFTVLCCDNMPDNGKRVMAAVTTLARQQSADLARWVESEVAFPASMVDRIVPAVTRDTENRLESLIGFPDFAAVVCEAFSQWVIEDRFCAGRPDWENDGIEMVTDVTPFERLKLRLLNGAHSLLAYTGLQRDWQTMAEAIADPALLSLVREYFAEAGASLDATPGIDIDAYTAALLSRFRNDALEHSLTQIAMDGSQKIPQRWLEGARINLERGRPISATARAVAAWMAYVRGGNRSGRTWQVDDPMAAKLADCHRARSTEAVDALLDLREIFAATLAEREDFRAAIRGAYVDQLNAEGNG